jgi:hypothetical protein
MFLLEEKRSVGPADLFTRTSQPLIRHSTVESWLCIPFDAAVMNGMSASLSWILPSCPQYPLASE